MQFTQKERDNETGLDYFGARYYGNTQGRFTSVDPRPVTKESFLNPQRWNQYPYVNNNPLSAIDPSGGDGQGKGGDKVISVFLDLAAKDVGTRTKTVNGKPVSGSTVPNFSDWQGTKSAAPDGYRVDLYGPRYATGGNTPIGNAAQFEAALKSSEVVIYVAHGEGGPLPGTNQNPFQQTSITPALQSGGNIHYNSDGKWATGGSYQAKPDVSAKVVVNFSCDSGNSGSYFNFTGQGQVMITIFSGPNGVSNADVLEKAANAFAKTYMTSNGDYQKAAEAANKVITDSWKTVPSICMIRLWSMSDRIGQTEV